MLRQLNLVRSTILLAFATAGTSQSLRLATPQQPWASKDGTVHLLRPIAAVPTSSDAALGSMMTPGWRLIWDGSTATPGHMVVRLQLQVVPIPPETSVTEVLQIGVSQDPGAVRDCLSAGLQGGSAQHLADRVINGRRYAVWKNGDSGMSQGIAATDLRTLVDGSCYAVDRFVYTQHAGDPDSKVTLTQGEGTKELDATLASLQLGTLTPDEVLISVVSGPVRQSANDGLVVPSGRTSLLFACVRSGAGVLRYGL